MSLQWNEDGTVDFHGPVADWAADFQKWYEADKGSSSVAFPTYTFALTNFFFAKLVERCEGSEEASKKAIFAKLEELAPRSPDGGLHLGGEQWLALLDFIAESTSAWFHKDHERAARQFASEQLSLNYVTRRPPPIVK